MNMLFILNTLTYINTVTPITTFMFVSSFKLNNLQVIGDQDLLS